MHDRKFLIFGGTTEGRMITEYLCQKDVMLHIYVVTEYGEKLLPQRDNVVIRADRLDEDGMYDIMLQEKYDMVIDATHPYAKEATANIVAACIRSRMEYTRLIRAKAGAVAGNTIWYVKTHEEAVRHLNENEGRIFLATGSKDLGIYYEGLHDNTRLYARVLPDREVFEQCYNLGMEGSHLIGMQGPFSTELNFSMFHEVGASFLVTKEAGVTGGFEEKIEAARKAGMTTIVVGREEEKNGLPFEAVHSMLRQRYFSEDGDSQKEISVIGIGMGNPDQLTYEAKKALSNAQIFIGAKRVIDVLKDHGKPVFYAFKAEDVLNTIRKNPQYDRVALVFSGDIGFYSGAKEILAALAGWSVKTYCGIPTIAYLASKLHISWENIKMMSLHGREGQIALQVQQNAKVFALLGGKDGVRNLCLSLIGHGLSNVRIFAGERLSYENERITEGVPEKLLLENFDTLTAVIIENSCPVSMDSHGIVTHGLDDSAFLRSEIPMTKSEVRSISISKLQLYQDSVIYDIGAGTGSVTIEMALLADSGHVYSIEQKPEAVTLIQENVNKFAVSNVTIVEGKASGVMDELECPTHAFIGGNAGELLEILDILWKKNPYIRIVINTISLESLADIMRYIETHPLVKDDIIQVAISKSRVLGRYHMMNGQNPIYVITLYRDL